MNTTFTLKSSRTPLLMSACAALFFSGVTTFASERWATLEAIHCVENPSNLTRPGPFGELGAYQFREGTWRMHTKAPFKAALDRSASDQVAVKHYDFLKRELEHAGIAVTPYTIALAWNGGLEAAVLGRSSAAARNYAERVANLAGTFEQETVASAR